MLRKRKRWKTIVVLNKIDVWDEFKESVLEDVIDQWKRALGTEVIFGACTKGYDPQMRQDIPMNLHGVDSIRNEIVSFLKEQGTAILFIHHLRDEKKKAYLTAQEIIDRYATAAAATSAAFGSFPIVGPLPLTGDSAALIAITIKMGQSLSQNVFNQENHWRNFAMGMSQFFIGAIAIKAFSSLIPIFGTATNAAVSFATVELIGWAIYHVLDEGNDPDKLSKEDIKKALDLSKRSRTA